MATKKVHRVRLLLTPTTNRQESETIVKGLGGRLVSWNDTDPVCPDVTFEVPDEAAALELMKRVGYISALSHEKDFEVTVEEEATV